MKPEEERLLDVALEELLGGIKPPDLTQQVLARLGHAPAEPSPGSNQPMPEVPQSPWASRSPSRKVARWMVVASLCTTAAVVLCAWVLWRSLLIPGAQEPPAQQVIRAPQSPRSPASLADSGARGHASPGEPPPRQSAAPEPPAAGEPLPSQPHRLAHAPLVAPPPVRKAPRTASPPPEPAPSAASPEQIEDEQVIAAIDRLIARRWEQEQVPVAEPASPESWCRRVFLDLLGRVPRVDELVAFLQDRTPLPQRKRQLVQRLLYAPEYQEQWAAYWADRWTVWLIGRTGGPMAQRVYRPGLQEFLYQALLENKPYDQLCYELLTATGSNRPGEPDYSGAVNFLLKHLDGKAIAATAQTARVFLGTQVQCTQCHNHPFNQWKQSQFWGLNAFFRQAVVRPGKRPGVFRLEDEDFPGEGPQPRWEEAEIYYELRNGLLKVAYPTFLDGRRIDPSGRVDRVNRRRELARLVVSSPLFAQAAVNRIWQVFLGYGFTRPVDDLGPHNPPSHPELFHHLAQCFAVSGYDLRRLMKWVVLSHPYGLSSRVPRGSFDDPGTGQPPLYSRFYLRQMRPEQLYESLALLAGTSAEPFAQHQRRRQAWVQRFMYDLKDDENSESSLWETSLTQTLMMWNGPLVQQVADPNRSALLAQVLSNRRMPPREKVQYLFLATLSRRPSSSELQMALHALRRSRGNEAVAWGDLVWALVNSGEFLLIR